MANPMCMGFEWAECSLSWGIMAFLFFLGALFRKWVANEALGTEFSLIGATILAEIGFFIVVLITHSIKWSFAVGLAGMLVGGFLLRFFGDTESGGGE